MIARYFATAIMRKQQGATGARPNQTPITVYFGHSVPGTDQSRRLYYRTLPERYQHTHRAPWLGKGYVKILGREAKPAVAAWNETDYGFIPNQITLEREGSSATVSADYYVVD
jgi:hypothetical protein